MQRTTLLAAALLIAGASCVGCEHRDAVAQYNPQLDSLLPTYYNARPDTTILDDQRKLFTSLETASTAAHPATPAPAASAPATTPETSPPAPPG